MSWHSLITDVVPAQTGTQNLSNSGGFVLCRLSPFTAQESAKYQDWVPVCAGTTYGEITPYIYFSS